MSKDMKVRGYAESFKQHLREEINPCPSIKYTV
jgi:hypothetical protein